MKKAIAWPTNVKFIFTRNYSAVSALTSDSAGAAWSRNGLANIRNAAKAMAIIGTASVRPSIRNMRGASTPSSSGCRARPSRYLLPSIPMPTPAPRAPRPIMMPAANAEKLAIDSIIYTLCELVLRTGMRHAEIDYGQHHENICLERDDQYVEDRPANLQNTRNGAPGQARAIQSCDQDEDEFSRE